MRLKDFPLWTHQREAVELMRKKKRNGLFLEVGCGKTLIICRKDNIKTWIDEIKLWNRGRILFLSFQSLN